MRFLAAFGCVASCVLLSFVFAPHLDRLAPAGALHTSVSARAEETKFGGNGKPGGQGGDDSCRWANDHECDEPDIGTGACQMGTDFSDCVHLRRGEDNSCQYHNDGECDEPNFGTGACTQGTDRADCGNIAWMRNQNDSCDTAFNGVCDEPGHGNGRCAARTDRSDCHGRNRPMSINDHFFGHDDRVLVPVHQTPWRFIGQLTLDSGEGCTATLIAPNVVVTAAHCINGNDGVNAAAAFEPAAGGPSARVIAYMLDPHYNYHRFSTGNDIDGLDWTLLRLDRPLGTTLGYAGVRNITAQGRAALSLNLMQAGFAWDTGSHLSGNLRCHMVAVHPDNTFAHECDTTRGDLGSAFIVQNGDHFDVVGVDSNFRSNHGGPFIYIAVSAAAFQPYVADFVAGRTGVRVGGGDKPKSDSQRR